MILNKQVGVFLNLVHNKFKQYVTEIFHSQGFNITPEQFLVMDTLWDEGVLSQQQIADIMIKDKNSVVKLIDGLEERNLVKRISNPSDRRQNLIQVTQYAKDIQDEVTDLAMNAVNFIINGIPKSQLYTFLRVLSKMGENMNKDVNLMDMAKKFPTNKANGKTKE
ncbi:MAG: MarR family transcriptional regulator [Bacteroidales bacterium]|jgi:DNA-binding MarR family transcriptional regulator|nr:MarR family transcriptional regulator [Bacteroidales bacterium]MCI1785537.1 MarR family transcriptional regulator [Bacteroidales bacterium]